MRMTSAYLSVLGAILLLIVVVLQAYSASAQPRFPPRMDDLRDVTPSIPPPNPPPECRSPERRQAFNSSYTQAFNFVRMLFIRRSNCGNWEDFLRAISFPAPFPRDIRDPYIRCVRLGYAAGLEAVRQWVSDYCLRQCVGTGIDIGESQARIYCNIPTFTALAAQNLCDTFNELGCRAAFTSFVNNNCPERRRRDRNFNQILTSACTSP